MKTKILLLSLAISLAGCNQFPRLDGAKEATSRVPYETITRVLDGDTVAIEARWFPYPDMKWSVRMSGIDTPEKGSRAHCDRERTLAAQARATTERLVRETNGRVRLFNVHHDKYGGRFNADIIMADGRNMSEELIRAGVARRYTGQGPKPNWC